MEIFVPFRGITRKRCSAIGSRVNGNRTSPSEGKVCPEEKVPDIDLSKAPAATATQSQIPLLKEDEGKVCYFEGSRGLATLSTQSRWSGTYLAQIRRLAIE
ncbi:hypothetical protein KIN20_011247 [Parelaphostrongylus tenuis]|uniref:Uncharacterized protein n=1 Tax=Parelaphostrongylus tenuis TaxID=148309 RepID=A0AAD5QMB0_PARTN|nr:hypothetical protein KIN20_011247 [Parelaphostrongylus tenuis]